MPSAAMTCPKIMQRPASVPDCTSSGPSGNPVPQKIQTKNGTNEENSIGAPPTMMLEEGEKGDDRGVSITRAAAGGAALGCVAAAGFETEAEDPNAASASGIGTVAEAEWNPLEEVDSALLSALCDPRERKALFRLEQVLLDFMTDTKINSVEVGGAYNSIVLNQGSNCNSSEIYIRLDEDAQVGMVAASQQGLQDVQYQQQRGLRQTSFQRLILHRLADRFHIIREQIINNSNGSNSPCERGLVDVGNSNVGGGQQQQQTFSPGLIRLVKTNESCIPSHLLIDVDLSLLINYKNPRARNNSVGNNAVAVNGSHNISEGTRSLSDSMASATLSETPASAAPSGSVGKKSNRKMVIMKRNSSGTNNHEGKSKGMQKGKSRRKKLEDREKAYEEARARIFGKEKFREENVERGDESVPQAPESREFGVAAMGSCQSSFSVENETASSAGAAHMVPSQLISTASTERLSSPLSEQEVGEQGHSVPPGIEAEFTRQPSLPSSANPSFPAAVTGGAVSKAVYRNRQQEENDPDFKRRSGVRPAYVPYMSNPYAPSAIGGNPYATPMGQQLSPPPAALVAAMHAQQQQQAHQAAHFYHGQLPLHPPPSPQQFPTPQDAGYGAAGNGVPSQWTGPHRGYFPTPPQRVGQEKHLQAWQQVQTRLNASQITRSSSGALNPTTDGVGMTNMQPKQHLKKVLWGDRGEPALGQSGLTAGQLQRDVATASTEGGEVERTGDAGGGAVAYKLEDFPALR